MKLLSSRLDGWLLNSPVSGRDLSGFRILYALFVLLTIYRSDYAASVPQVAFDPPPGPFMLLVSAPPLFAIWAIQAALCFALAALAIGWHTKLAAVAAAVLQIVIYGIGYGYGKIDHTILLPLVPLLLSFSAWGSSFSVDAQRKSPNLVGHYWAPRSLAIALGVAMLTSGLSKVLGGWLSWDSQATYGYAVIRAGALSAPLSGTATLLPTDSPVVWEFMDYATVVLECSIIFAALYWRAFYVAIASLGVFHIITLVVLGILFPYNLLVYAAFIPWSKLDSLISMSRIDRFSSVLASSTVLRTVTWVLLASSGLLVAWIRPIWFVPTIYTVAIVIGAGVGLGYLGTRAWRVRSLVT
ncbi:MULTISPECIES: HTTM domain-containing protein [unclassified Mycobacterium]|uniref:HTTM domain-containing protein n=1 Tax=unclassified Mycobacterium TaxID=2642494 RepID=UPI0029C8DF21|nr:MULTISPECIES: HTTM domain-containing protein [unclassified Mycobacterium]